MMAADGSMAEEEVGRLNAAVGGSPALLKAGLRYVSKVRVPQFLALAAPMLDERQRLCILLNACDTMMSDHKVVKVESDLFRRMLTSFEVTEKEFERYLNIIFLKNDVPEEATRVSAVAKKSDIPALRTSKQEEGVVFQRKKEWEEETGEPGKDEDQTRQAESSTGKRAEQPSEMETRISNTMRQNTDRLSKELDADTSLESLEQNARTQAPAGTEALKVEGESDLRTVRDTDANISSKKSAGKSDGPADQRAVRDTDADISSKKSLDKNDGAADQRAVRDADADSSSKKTNGKRDGPADQRSARDTDAENGSDKAKGKSDGPADQRAVRDAHADNGSDKAKGKSDGPVDQRAARDTDADNSSKKATGKSDSPVGQRAVADTDTDNRSDKAKTKNDGPADPRALRDKEGATNTSTALEAAEGPGEIRALQDTSGGTGSLLPPGISAGLSQRLRDAKNPTERRELTDADGLPANRRLSDARHAFDPTANESSDSQ